MSQIGRTKLYQLKLDSPLAEICIYNGIFYRLSIRNLFFGPFQLAHSAEGFCALINHDNNENSAGRKSWLSDVRAAQNFYEQNVTIVQDCEPIRLPCSFHYKKGVQETNFAVGRLHFITSKPIAYGNAIFAWPDLLLTLSCNLPTLTMKHVKGKSSLCLIHWLNNSILLRVCKYSVIFQCHKLLIVHE